MPITFNRNTVPALAIVAAAGLTMSACRDETPREPTTSTTADPVGQAQSAAQDAAGAVGDAATQAKNSFLDGASRQLENLEAEIEEFVASARERMPDASAEVNRVRDELHNSVARARVELEKVRNAGADGWKNASASFQQAIAEVQRAFNQVKAQFSAGPDSSATPDTPDDDAPVPPSGR